MQWGKVVYIVHMGAIWFSIITKVWITNINVTVSLTFAFRYLVQRSYMGAILFNLITKKSQSDILWYILSSFISQVLVYST